MVCEPCNNAPAGLLALLIELYDDLERWRQAGGDARELAYVLDTADRIDPEAVDTLRRCIDVQRHDR